MPIAKPYHTLVCHAYSPSITVHFYLPNLWISSYSSLIFLSLSSATFTSSIIPIMFTIHYISGTYLFHAHTSVSCFPSTGSARNSVYPPVNNTYIALILSKINAQKHPYLPWQKVRKNPPDCTCNLLIINHLSPTLKKLKVRKTNPPQKTNPPSALPALGGLKYHYHHQFTYLYRPAALYAFHHY